MEPLQPGDPDRVGRYLLGGRLGEGGMGRVFWGRSPSGRPVAVKVVRRELADQPEFRRRFALEVEAARRVGGFHTAQVVDADLDGDPPWLVTAYIPGPSLATAVARRGPLPVPALRVLGAGLAEALEAIHAAGILHRDLKPANIVLADDGPRVIDFGIARALDAALHTQAGVLIGTPGFMAPEQLIAAGSLSPATDVFALGAVLCFAAGAHPFGHGGGPAVAMRILAGEPDLSAAPPALRDLVARCLDSDPANRPTPADILHELADHTPAPTVAWLPLTMQDMLDDHTLPALVPSAADKPAAPPEQPLSPSAVQAPQARRRRLIMGAAIGAGALGVATVVLIGALRGSPAGSFEGSWRSIDTDGSTQTAEITSVSEREVQLVVRDSRAMVCGGAAATMSVRGTVSDNTLPVSYTVACEGYTGIRGPFDVQFHYDPAADVLTDSTGVTWERT